MSEKIIRVEHLQQFFPVGGFGKNTKYVRDVYERIKVKLWNIIKDEMEGKEVKYEINKVS